MRSGKFTVLNGVLVVGVVIVAAVLGISHALRGDDVPTSDVPAVGWEDAQDDRTTGEGIAVGEPAPGTTPTDDVPQDIPEVTEETADVPEDDVQDMPTSFNIALPFTSQAPFGSWDAVHEETCEEASVYMVTQYFTGASSGKTDPAATERVLLDMVAYEEAQGYGVSVDAADLKAIIEGYYDGQYTVDIIEDPTVDALRAFIADGYPVVVPAAGRLLGNPFFTGEGPLYHMLVIRGYDDGQFITNDPGTRHGENYTYDVDVLMRAMHDWNNGDPANGAPVVLILKPATKE